MNSESSFQNGEHPLEGVPNLGELPTPEDLKGLSKYVIVSLSVMLS